MRILSFKKCKTQYIFILAILLAVSLFICGCSKTDGLSFSVYQITDISEYGNYPGYPESSMPMPMCSLFPASIQPDCCEPKYTFISDPLIGYEAYLEFSIAEKSQFDAYVRDVTAGLQEGSFYFDDAYVEYVLINSTPLDENKNYLYDAFQLDQTPLTCEDGTTYYRIEYANIAKILVNPTEQRIVFVVINVLDGGGSTSVFHAFFDRFHISPRDYEIYAATIEHWWEK